MVSFEVVTIDKADGMNVIIGQAHFIKTVEDLHETLAGASPHLRFGLGFCEASAARLVRRSGNEPELAELAARNALAIGAGHAFIVLLREGFPINVLNQVQAVPEVCGIYCATLATSSDHLAHRSTGPGPRSSARPKVRPGTGLMPLAAGFPAGRSLHYPI
jgi:adenosine/AMP kinase